MGTELEPTHEGLEVNSSTPRKIVTKFRPG
jgi:hypothetical protein